MIITVDYKHSDAAVQRMCDAVDAQILRDVNLNGMQYTVERDEYTSMTTDDGHEPDADSLKLFFSVIQPALDAS